jgi:tetratricopeptide (TPR) repeat protein
VTTFYGAIASLQQQYPKAMVKDGRRFVDNGKVVTTAGISAGIDGSLHVVARLLGRRVADQVARYMEYHWSPDAFLARDYAYLNPSTDARGRLAQSAQMQMDEKNYAEALKAFRAVVADDPGSQAGWRGVGYALKAMKQHAESADALARSIEGDASPHAAHMLYVAAGQYALAGRGDDAVAALEKASALGYVDRTSIEKDPELAAVRNDPRLRKLFAAR